MRPCGGVNTHSTNSYIYACPYINTYTHIQTNLHPHTHTHTCTYILAAVFRTGCFSVLIGLEVIPRPTRPMLTCVGDTMEPSLFLDHMIYFCFVFPTAYVIQSFLCMHRKALLGHVQYIEFPNLIWNVLLSIKMVNVLHLYSAFQTSGNSKRFTMLPNIHPFINTFTHRRRSQPRRATASSSGAVRVRRLPHGHLDTLYTLALAGVRTSNLPVTSQPAQPPGPLPPEHKR